MKLVEIVEAKPRIYKGRYICQVGDAWRVKETPNDSHAVHHGSFDSMEAAKKFIDADGRTRRPTIPGKQAHRDRKNDFQRKPKHPARDL